ncbi:MAG: hypothetical protein AAGA58_02985 [Verrucomicrobiota bacterium]
MTPSTKPRIFELILRWMCALLFVGHGLVTIQGKFSIRSLLFYEDWMSANVQSWFGISWNDWVTDATIASRIDAANVGLGVLFLFIAFCCIVPGRRWWTLANYFLGGLLLIGVSIIKFQNASSGIGMFLEHASQFIAPFILFAVVCCRWSGFTSGLARFAVASTFFFHGLYAFGVTGEMLGIEDAPLWMEHPTPGKFLFMTMETLQIEDEGMARGILKTVGVLDFIAAFLILIPAVPAILPLGWMIPWGFVTALARPWAYFNPAEPATSLFTWVPEMLLRTPHYALPLLLLLRNFAAKSVITDTKNDEAPEQTLIHEKPRVSSIDPFPDVRDILPRPESGR